MVKRLGQRFKQVYRQGPINTRAQEAALSRWYRSILGQEVISVERELISRAIAGRFGASMAQLDSGYHEALFEKRLFGSGILVSQLENRAPCPVVCAEPENLPFEPESLDMVLMHHTLDICENPYQAVREGAIALKPGGLLIVLGFNPFSTWGVRSMIQGQRNGAGIWNSRFIRSGRVEDWMHVLDFELERHEKHIYKPPYNRPNWLKRIEFGHKLQKLFFPFTGAVYLLVGYKRVFGKINQSEKRPLRGILEPVVTANSKIRS
ncbi:class I SAM-dependent methyltransferase [Reinekea sp. G2M2-21]|uniref:class I SAM-dependent methyltransferase n=1 Tax=Reinekea sp. G2M2-21 TaxID=2788942 RepID=UPI0018AB6E4B|nr:class I SAM-dependent methyltransferase [Reinekea sp. G2M2-21]